MLMRKMRIMSFQKDKVVLHQKWKIEMNIFITLVLCFCLGLFHSEGKFDFHITNYYSRSTFWSTLGQMVTDNINQMITMRKYPTNISNFIGNR
jgi:hypothetical protein